MLSSFTNDPEIKKILRSEFQRLHFPFSPTEKVYKDECVLTFDTPFTTEGLYVNLATLQGVSADLLEIDCLRTGSKLYLHQQWEQIPIPKIDDNPIKVAIGKAGGFITTDRYKVIKRHSLAVILTDRRVSITLPDPDLPEFVANICAAIIENDGMRSKMQVIDMTISPQ